MVTHAFRSAALRGPIESGGGMNDFGAADEIATAEACVAGRRAPADGDLDRLLLLRSLVRRLEGLAEDAALLRLEHAARALRLAADDLRCAVLKDIEPPRRPEPERAAAAPAKMAERCAGANRRAPRGGVQREGGAAVDPQGRGSGQ